MSFDCCISQRKSNGFSCVCCSEKKMFPKRNTLKSCRVTFASLLVAIGTLLMVFAPYFYHITTKLVLTLSTKPTFELWRKNPMPLYLEFYFFNWTNPEDIYAANSTPRFEEVGPFVFEETKEKVNISWNSNNTVTFRHLRYWYFNEEKSCSNLSTKITTINSIAVTAAYLLKDWNFVYRKSFDLSLKYVNTKLWKTASIGEVLFDGYEDPLINIAKTMPKITDLSIPPYDKFGWFYTRNGSYLFDGSFNMESSGENFGNTKHWNYRNNLTIYEGECDRVRGSAGEFYSPNRKRDEIGFFSTDICRYVPLDYVKDVDVDGTSGYKYVLGDSFFDNGTKVPENKCYCGDYCSPYGALNISACRYGAPGFVSQPHFYGADPYYLNLVDGLKPTRERHQMFMVIEPITGIPLHVEARLQLNLLVQPIKSISLLENVPKFYFPVVWFEQKARIPTGLHILLKILLHLELILRCIAGVILLIGIPALILLLYRPFIRNLLCGKSPQEKNILSETSTVEIMEFEKPLMTHKEDSVGNER